MFLGVQPFRLISTHPCLKPGWLFLCNAFIHMHGRMHTTRSHSRLYPVWRLPFAPTLRVLEQRFDVLLESRINAGLRALLSRSRKTAYPDPNESTLLTLPLSASTSRSVLVAQGNTAMEKNPNATIKCNKYENRQRRHRDQV